VRRAIHSLAQEGLVETQQMNYTPELRENWELAARLL
jgi:hypothetical protein